MASLSNRAVLKPIRTLFNVGSIGELTDGQLLERFATDPSEVAELSFAVLVERHGPMVLRVCRSMLPDVNDAHDAFQATFLVLVRKARGLWVEDSIGPWLHQVAYRTAACARAATARRRKHERTAAALRTHAAIHISNEPARVLHEEIERLPEYFRVAVVLCDLEGRSHDQAARHLGLPLGTVKSRLRRGRDRLRDRLIERGVGPDSAMFGAARLPARVGADIPAALAESTCRLALHWATAGARLTAPATLLARGMLRTMAATAWTKFALVLLVVGASAGAASGLVLADSSGAKVRHEQATPRAQRQEIPLHEVKRGTLRKTASQRGVVRAAGAVPVLCALDVPTTILSIVPEGTKVKQGQIVCELDTAALWDAVTNQQIVCNVAVANYENAKLTREVAEVAVVEAEVLVKSGDLKRREDLRDQTEHRNQTTLEDFKAAEALSRGVEFAEQATSRLEKAKLEHLMNQAPTCELRALSTGFVYYDNDPIAASFPQIGKGKAVRRGQRIFSIQNIDGPMQVALKLPETVAYQVRSGMPVDITVDPLAGVKLVGFVDSIAPAPEPQKQVSLTKPPEHSVSISIRTSDPALRPGMLAHVEIMIAKLDNVLTVPTQAIVRYDGKDHLAVKKADGSFDWREVELGVEADKDVEVRKGVLAGDLVALKPLAVLRQGRINE